MIGGFDQFKYLKEAIGSKSDISVTISTVVKVSIEV